MYNLGFPNDVAQSAYYPSDQRINYHEIDNSGKIRGDNAIHPENDCEKKSSHDKTIFEVLQASAEDDDEAQTLFSSEDLQVLERTNRLRK